MIQTWPPDMYQQRWPRGILVVEPGQIGWRRSAFCRRARRSAAADWRREACHRRQFSSHRATDTTIGLLHGQLAAWLANRRNVRIVLPCWQFGAPIFATPGRRARSDRGRPGASPSDIQPAIRRNKLVDESRGIKAFEVEAIRRLHGWYAGGDHRPPPFRKRRRLSARCPAGLGKERHEPQTLVSFRTAAVGDRLDAVVGERPFVLRAMIQWLDVGERPRQADYVMVLNGGENNRPLVAAALLKAGLARHVLVAEVATTPGTDESFHPPTKSIAKCF